MVNTQETANFDRTQSFGHKATTEDTTLASKVTSMNLSRKINTEKKVQAHLPKEKQNAVRSSVLSQEDE